MCCYIYIYVICIYIYILYKSAIDDSCGQRLQKRYPGLFSREVADADQSLWPPKAWRKEDFFGVHKWVYTPIAGWFLLKVLDKMDDNWEYPYFRTFRTPPYSYESTLQDLGSAMIQKVLDMLLYPYAWNDNHSSEGIEVKCQVGQVHEIPCPLKTAQIWWKDTMCFTVKPRVLHRLRLAGSCRTRWGTAHVEGQRRGQRHDLVDIAGMMGWMLILQEFHR